MKTGGGKAWTASLGPSSGGKGISEPQDSPTGGVVKTSTTYEVFFRMCFQTLLDFRVFDRSSQNRTKIIGRSDETDRKRPKVIEKVFENDRKSSENKHAVRLVVETTNGTRVKSRRCCSQI